MEWSGEAEEELQKLKKHLLILPTLASLVANETLIIYLSASNEAINAVLEAERDKKRMSVYFISRILQGAERNYSIIKKLVLCLIFAARQLFRYFKAHSIRVLMDQPIWKILTQLERSR